MDAYWRACDYLCVGMIYLHDNPLLKQPLRPEHVNIVCSDIRAPIPARPLHRSTLTAGSASPTWI